MRGHIDPTKLHPLRPATISALQDIGRGPIDCYAVNHGISDRLLREGLIEQVDVWTRSKWRITDAGRARLAEIEKD